MAIRKVIRIIDGIEQEVLSLDDILEQIGGKRGDAADFIGLASVLDGNIDLNGDIILPETFVGKNLNLNATSPFSATPTILTFNSTGDSKTLSVSTSGTYRVSSFPNWISIDKTFAKGNATFIVSASPNNNLNSPSREGSIVFSAGSDLATVTVSQGGNPLTAILTPSTNQTVSSASDSLDITFEVSNTISVDNVSIDNTNGFTLSEPSITTSGNLNIYTWTLDYTQADEARSTSFSLTFSGQGYNDTIGFDINQEAFTPSLTLDPTSIEFPSAGDIISYTITSNTTWTTSISSPSFGFQHSKQSNKNFTFNALTGTGNATIYVKALFNESGRRIGTSSVTTTYSRDNVSDTVDLVQLAAEEWDNDDITITGFSVASNGDVTAPTVTITGDIDFTVSYSSGYSSGTYPLVSSNTTRTVSVSVTVPNGYSNSGETFTKSATAVQDGLPIFKSSQITLEATRDFAVSTTGTITSPSLSVPTGITATLRYTTGNNNTGTAYTISFPKVTEDTTRYANAVVVVPEGYFNEGSTVIKTVSDVQGYFDPTLTKTAPQFSVLSFPKTGDTDFVSFESNHSWISSLSNTNFEQSLTETSGFTTDDLTGSGNDVIWVRALTNKGEPRTAFIKVETDFGHLDNSFSVLLSQEGTPTYAFSTWDGLVSINADGVVSATQGNSKVAPTLDPTSFARVENATSRTVSVTVTAPSGYNNVNSEFTDDVTVTQPKFTPTISATPSARLFASSGGSSYYDVPGADVNTTWTATITGDGFEHSTSSTTGFKTTAINGTSVGDRIYVRALAHEGTARTGTATVTTTQGFSDVSDTVDLSQAAAPTFTVKDITVGTTTAFDVNSFGTITAPNVSIKNDIAYTISYTTAENSGTAYTTFPKVSADTTRYANVSVTIPSGYQSAGTVLTKSVSATQEDFNPTLTKSSPTGASLAEFTIASQVKSFSFNSNYSWVATISGTGFQHSKTNSSSTFTTDDLTGSGNDTIYVRALKNTGEERAGSASVSTNFGHLDNTITYSLSQDGEPTFTIDDWTGVVSINRQNGAVSATTGNSLATPTFTPTSFALVSSSTNRTVSVTVKAPDGYNNHNGLVTGNVTVSQAHFIPSVSVPASLSSFSYTGQTRSYTVTSNTTWSATISGAGFSHSTSSTTGFKTTAITGTSAGDTIYVKAAGHLGAERYGTATVTTTFGGNDVSDEVSLTQLEAPTYTGSDISISGFAVNYAGTITAPTVSPAATAIVYSTATNGGGTAYTSSFPVVSSNTRRYCKVSVKVPAGYQNTGDTVSRTVSYVQPFKATIDVSPNNKTFSSGENYQDYTVASNTTWAVDVWPDWITIPINDLRGGGTDTKFRATATAQSNPSVRRYSTIRVSTNTATNGIVRETVNIQQNPISTWSLSNIPNLGDAQWSVLNLKSTVASLSYFNFNIPYTFNFLDTNFDKTNFGFYVNFGAGRSTSSHRFTTGNKTFTLTYHNDVLPIQNSMSFDVGQQVSIILRNNFGYKENKVDKWMTGNVTSWNTSTKRLTVNIPSTNNIVSNNTTTNYTNWEITQISGDAASFPRLYTKNENVSGAARTTTIKLDDTSNAYEQGVLSKTITQPLQAWSGGIYVSGQYRTAIGTNNYVFTNTRASTTVLYMSVSVRTNYVQPMTITSDSNSGIWISKTSNGSATGIINADSTTGTTTQFYVRWGSTTGGYMTVTIASSGNPTTEIDFSIIPQGGTGGGTCLVEGTMVTLSDGTITTIESLIMGESVKSPVIDTLPQSDDADIVLPWSTQNLVTSDDYANVTGNTMSVVDSIYNFNNGLIKSTESHGHFIKRGNDYMFKNAFNVEVGDYFVTENLEEILIEDITIEFGEFNVYNLDVEENDLYIANGIITHNAIKISK
jgi:hypothetical protein